MMRTRVSQLGLILLLGSGCGPLAGSRHECSPCEAGTPGGNKTLLTWSGKGKASAEQTEESNGGGAADRPGEDAIATDRPDFTEASSTVGKGRIQLEAGYTFIRDRAAGVTTTNHSYPEALLRIGAFAEWLEFRIGQNFGQAVAAGFGAPS